MGKRKGERPGFERDRKKDRGGTKRETGIGEKERERERESERDRCGRVRGTGIADRERKKIKRETGAVKREPQRVNHR